MIINTSDPSLDGGSTNVNLKVFHANYPPVYGYTTMSFTYKFTCNVNVITPPTSSSV